jgi:hypothetical protein
MLMSVRNKLQVPAVGAPGYPVRNIDTKRWFGNVKIAKTSVKVIFDEYQKMLGLADARLRSMCKELRRVSRPSRVNSLRKKYLDHVRDSNYILRHLKTQREAWEAALVMPKYSATLRLPNWPIHISRNRVTGRWTATMAKDAKAFYDKAGYTSYTNNKKAIKDAIDSQIFHNVGEEIYEDNAPPNVFYNAEEEIYENAKLPSTPKQRPNAPKQRPNAPKYGKFPQYLPTQYLRKFLPFGWSSI